jgi:hypothetical protein
METNIDATQSFRTLGFHRALKKRLRASKDRGLRSLMAIAIKPSDRGLRSLMAIAIKPSTLCPPV